MGRKKPRNEGGNFKRFGRSNTTQSAPSKGPVNHFQNQRAYTGNGSGNKSESIGGMRNMAYSTPYCLQDRTPYCNQCKTNHRGNCGQPEACFRCGRMGHKARECMTTFQQGNTNAPSTHTTPNTGSVKSPIVQGKETRRGNKEQGTSGSQARVYALT